GGGLQFAPAGAPRPSPRLFWPGGPVALPGGGRTAAGTRAGPRPRPARGRGGGGGGPEDHPAGRGPTPRPAGARAATADEEGREGGKVEERGRGAVGREAAPDRQGHAHPGLQPAACRRRVPLRDRLRGPRQRHLRAARERRRRDTWNLQDDRLAGTEALPDE